MRMTRELRCLLALWESSTPMEREEGRIYYPRQQGRLYARARENSRYLYQAVGAFAALSPNNSEKITYQALDICMDIVEGRAPIETKAPSYGRNKIKALQILAIPSNKPEDILRGNKVRAFYFNTMDPEHSSEVTVDGHMKNAWRGKIASLKHHSSDVSNKEYIVIAHDFRRAAFLVGIPCTEFQATLWITHKRVHNILPNLQIPFEFTTVMA